MTGKERLSAAYAVLKTAAMGLAGVKAESNADEVKAHNGAARNAVAHFFAVAYSVNAGDSITSGMLKPLVKATGDSLKARLSEVRKIAKKHTGWPALAEKWQNPEHVFEDGEVRAALNAVSVPSDPLGTLSKAAAQAAKLGETLDDALDAVKLAYAQAEAEAEFLAVAQ